MCACRWVEALLLKWSSVVGSIPTLTAKEVGMKIEDYKSEELAYERKLRRMMEGTPEYWARLTDEHTAKTINSGGLPIYDVAGEIGS